MQLAWGLVVVVLSLLCWNGQVISWVAPRQAARLGLTEAEDAVEPTYWADIRGEAAWDALTLWSMVIAGALMVADHHWWPVFGLVGGGMYAYFAGRGVFTRLVMMRRGLRIGSEQSVRVGLTFLSVWGVMAVITIVAAAVELEL